MVMSLDVFTPEALAIVELIYVILRGFFGTREVDFTICTEAGIVLRLCGT